MTRLHISGVDIGVLCIFDADQPNLSGGGAARVLAVPSIVIFMLKERRVAAALSPLKKALQPLGR